MRSKTEGCYHRVHNKSNTAKIRLLINIFFMVGSTVDAQFYGGRQRSIINSMSQVGDSIGFT